jgi:hypothetical protein
VEKYGFKNKLPMELAGQVAEDWAFSLNRIPFSMNTFTEQLVEVFVVNDLVPERLVDSLHWELRVSWSLTFSVGLAHQEEYTPSDQAHQARS